jgi:hypothetical protein
VEFDAWISKNVKELPQMKSKSIQKFSNKESAEMKDMIATIEIISRILSKKRVLVKVSTYG